MENARSSAHNPSANKYQGAASGEGHNSRTDFCEKRVSHHQTKTNSITDPVKLEELYQQGKLLDGRNITARQVFDLYVHNDRTSLRSALFLQLCFFRGVALKPGQVIKADAVVSEYLRIPDRNNKCKVGVARFLAECCLGGWPLKNKEGKDELVRPEAVVDAYQEANAQLELARFLEQCCLRGLWLKNKEGKNELVKPEEVVKTFPDSQKGKLGMALFLAQCCLRCLLLKNKEGKDELVNPEMVVKVFPDSLEGKFCVARFLAECCLRCLPLKNKEGKDELVKPEAVVYACQKANAQLQLARFLEECCLRRLLLKNKEGKDELVKAEAVVDAFQKINAQLELARFLAECCLRGLWLKNKEGKDELVKPEEVVKTFPDSQKGKLGVARFLAECCLRCLLLKNKEGKDALVKPETVVDAYQKANAQLPLVRFLAECCLRGLPLKNKKGKGELVKPETVVYAYQEADVQLELARFLAECCLRGLPLKNKEGKDELVKPETVVKAFPDSQGGRLGVARFMARCCLRSLRLKNKEGKDEQVKPETVVKAFPGGQEGKLGLARFLGECCLRRLLLKNKEGKDELVKPDTVVDACQKINAQLELARFLSECYQRGLPLKNQEGNDELVKPETVVDALQKINAQLELARFLGECCLRGLLLKNKEGKDELVEPETVVDAYEHGHWMLERAIFLSNLALRSIRFKGKYLSDSEILPMFEDLPGNHSHRRIDYLIQRLGTLSPVYQVDERQAIHQRAWTILNKHLLPDDQLRYQHCILQHIAMEHHLTVVNVKGQHLTADQVLENIDMLRPSFHTTRLKFYYLADCYFSGRRLNGFQVQASQVESCLGKLPVGSNLRHALNRWFDQQNSANTGSVFVDNFLQTPLRGVTRQERSTVKGPGSIVTDSPFRPDVTGTYQHVPAIEPPEFKKVLKTGLNADDGRDEDKCLKDARDYVNPFDEAGHYEDALAQLPGTSGTSGGAGDLTGNVTWAEILIANLQEGTLPCKKVSQYRDEKPVVSPVQPGGAPQPTTDASLCLKQLPGIGESTPMQQNAGISQLTVRALELIHEVNSLYTQPVILINGSFSRCLQGISHSFNDIDMIGTAEGITTLISGLHNKFGSHSTKMDDLEVPVRFTAYPIAGCHKIALPEMVNITLTEGDLRKKTMNLQASIYQELAELAENAANVYLHERGLTVTCLSFHLEVQLMTTVLEKMCDYLARLTSDVKGGYDLYIPRSLLFYHQSTPDQKMHALLMRCMLTLNKAEEFSVFLSEGKKGLNCAAEQADKTRKRLTQCMTRLKSKLIQHPDRDSFIKALTDWLSNSQPGNNYEKKRHDFVGKMHQSLLSWRVPQRGDTLL